MKGLSFILLLLLAYVLMENGEVFFAIIAAVVGFLSLIAEAESKPRMPRVGGPVKKSEARDTPPFTYQLANAGKAVGGVLGALWGAVRWLLGKR